MDWLVVSVMCLIVAVLGIWAIYELIAGWYNNVKRASKHKRH